MRVRPAEEAVAISSHPNDSRTFQSSSRNIAAIRVAAPIFLVIGLVIAILTLASGRLFQAGFLLLANVLVLIVFVSLGRDVRGGNGFRGLLSFRANPGSGTHATSGRNRGYPYRTRG
jgi:hypothetical protein